MVKPRVDLKKHREWLRKSRFYSLLDNWKREFLEISKEYLRGNADEFFVYSSPSSGSFGFGPIFPFKGSFNPKELFGKPYREVLERAVFRLNAKTYTTDPMIENFERRWEDILFSAMSIKPVEMDVYLKRKPEFRVSFDPLVYPHGASSVLKHAEAIEEPKIPDKIYSLYEEKLPAKDSLFEAIEKGFDYEYLRRVFSAGAFGKEKRMVETRNSITAVDDYFAEFYKERILDFPSIDKVEVYTSYYLYNRFVVLLMPGFGFENFEAWWEGTTWGLKGKGYFVTVERERHKRRWRYAESQAGGYYASKHAVFEYLYKRRRKATAIVFREVYFGYNIPVGVWQVRENVRSAFSNKIYEGVLEHALDAVGGLLKIPMKEYLSLSAYLNQKRLVEF